ncbi:zinc-binding dehydrogenase, partial [Streptomyces eurythermus]
RAHRGRTGGGRCQPTLLPVRTLCAETSRSTSAIRSRARGEKKPALARELGADHAFDHTEADWAQRVREVSPAGVQVVLDAVGG